MKLKPYLEYKNSGIEWIGDIPIEWNVEKLKFNSEINKNSLPENFDPDYEFYYLDISNVKNTGKIQNIELMRFEDAPSRARRIPQSNDTIISTVRTYLKAIAYLSNIPENFIVSTGFSVLNPHTNLLPRYLYYIVSSDLFVQTIVAHSKGIAYPAINSNDLANLPIWYPDIETQKKLSYFLDKRISKIDQTIERYSQLLELLKEKRIAFINHVVTNGLNPAAKMKDSGVEWIGEIPKHWKVKKAKQLFIEINNRSKTDDEELLSVSHITGVTLRSLRPDINMFMAETTEGYKICEIEDLVINTMWAWMGAMGFSNYRGVVSPSYNVYRFKLPGLKTDYYDMLLRTPRFTAEATRWSKGVWTSRLRLYPEGFFQIHFPVPPVDEQLEIGILIDQETDKINKFESTISNGMNLLKEYKNSLIHHIVTGKVDVKEEAG